jgi:hypothetical protein
MRCVHLAAGMLCVAAVLPIAALAQATVTDEVCGKAKGTPAALYEQVSKDTKLREMRRSDAFVALEDGGSGTLWTFTLPAHPAHPAVVCRRILERRGLLEVPTTIQCNGAQAACAKLKSDFDVLNDRMIEDLYKQKK